MNSEFNFLYEKYKKEVFSYAYYLSGDYSIAEEICQDVFLKVYLNIAKFEGKSSFKTWVYTITKNTYFDYIRKNKKDVLLDKPDFFKSFLKDNSLNPEEHTLNTEKKNLIDIVLKRLPVHQRNLIILRDIQGLSYKEISSITKQKLNTVKVSIYRARKNFQKLFHEMEGR